MATQKFIQTADETLGEDSNDFSPYSLSANNGSGNPTNNSGNPGAGQQAAGNAATAAADDKKKAAQTAAVKDEGSKTSREAFT